MGAGRQLAEVKTMTAANIARQLDRLTQTDEINANIYKAAAQLIRAAYVR